MREEVAEGLRVGWWECKEAGWGGASGKGWAGRSRPGREAGRQGRAVGLQGRLPEEGNRQVED